MDSDTSSDSAPSTPSYESSNYDHSMTCSTTEHISIFLTDDDVTNTLFVSSTGQHLYRAHSAGGFKCTQPHITQVTRLYGSAAHAAREEALRSGDAFCEGLLLAEMEWLRRTRASRIRFGGGARSKQYAIDVRVDEYLKSTKGRGLSKMFATADGRVYKWKADVGAPAYLIECEEGRRVSAPLVTFQEGKDGEMSCLNISTCVLGIVDQIIVTWIIMERERRLHCTPPSGSYL